MSYRIESATKEEWVARCFAAETRLALYEAAEHPKMLWVDPSSADELNMYIGHASATMDYLNMDIAYIRKDISDANYKSGFEDGCAHITEDYEAGESLDLRAGMQDTK
jgi:hypothetical protein